MDLIEESFRELYPDREWRYVSQLKYSGKFSAYNGNIRQRYDRITVSLSRKWKGISPEMQKGIIQELLQKLFGGKKKETLAIDLYHRFLKHAHLGAEQKHWDETLAESFERVNERYFDGMMDIANLRWGGASASRFGTYEYGSDTITISETLGDDPELVDYVMYHEMLHKKHKYTHSRGRSLHHSAAFRRDEKAYPNQAQLERRLSRLATRRHLRRTFFGFGR
ncbi:M48 family metallopeptidase [Candidatus Woesearchaeota archaeon]|nr:M48 family metallopeptidase [Candidatus Woesearchaeota archaeon]